MAHLAATTPVDLKQERLSFAKIAAAGIKPPIVSHPPNTNSHNSHKQDIHSPPRDGAAILTPSNTNPQPAVAVPKPKKLIQLQSKDTKDTLPQNSNGPEVRVQIVDSAPSRSEQRAPEGFLVPTLSEDAGTQLSSSSGSNKPPSVDGKSVASGTTFALDEKESLRPDDSASVKAAEDDDMYSASGSGLPSRVGSDDGVRAFSDQLREISAMGPSRRGGPPPTFAAATRGVLYVPPQGPGVGAIPGPARCDPTSNPGGDVVPDFRLLDALNSPRDRVFVMKLEQDVIDFLKDDKEPYFTLPQCNTFYRLLAHKMADYYSLDHQVDNHDCIHLFKKPGCAIPPPLTGITAPSTAASTPPPAAPAMKILRRGVDGPAIANGSNMPSKSASEAGDSGDEKKKAPATREEREARYEAARLRIMGSAKPIEPPETPNEKQESRSSSATGKKNKKKAREDNDDGFEARSAYSNYFNPPFPSEGVVTPPYGYTPAAEPTPHQYSMPYPQQGQGPPFPPMQMQGPSNSSWIQQPYHSVDPTQAWAQSQSGAYDLSADFQRNMSLQSTLPQQTATLGYGQPYQQGYPPQYYAPQQGWQPQQQYQVPVQAQAPQPGYGYAQVSAMNTPIPAMAQPQDSTLPYAFGQLPSQTIGRPPNKNEHPLPGSYKGKNFNPQSQAFVPGQADARSFSPYGSPIAQAGFSQSLALQGPPQLSRHSSAQSQSSSFSSPHQNQPQALQHRLASQPLTHPLPHGPVYPSQPSPNVPLPAKPGSMHPLPNMQQPSSSPGAHIAGQNQSILAKWGAPPSLPAKPPPANEPFDSAKITQIQRQPFNGAAAARQGSFPVRM